MNTFVHIPNVRQQLHQLEQLNYQWMTVRTDTKIVSYIYIYIFFLLYKYAYRRFKKKTWVYIKKSEHRRFVFFLNSVFLFFLILVMYIDDLVQFFFVFQQTSESNRNRPKRNEWTRLTEAFTPHHPTSAAIDHSRRRDNGKVDKTHESCLNNQNCELSVNKGKSQKEHHWGSHIRRGTEHAQREQRRR